MNNLCSIFDTHCHLDYLDESSLANLVNNCKERSIFPIMTIAVDETNQNHVINIAEKSPLVYCTQGVHPHDARNWNQTIKNQIMNNLSHPKVKAIGEIGLDYHYDQSPREVQRKVFEEQLDLAAKYQKPIVIHSREAEDDTIAIIKNFLPLLKKGGVFHSFTSNKILAQFALENNFFFGFNGIITFKAADNVREVLQMVPIDRILIETDAPYLAPIPYRGKENTPLYLPIIAKAVCALKNISQEELLPKIYQNGLQLFGIKLDQDL